MKTRFLVIILSFLTACSSRNDTGPRSYSMGSFSAKMNQKDWSESYPKGFQVIRGFTVAGGFPPAQCEGEHYFIILEWYNAKAIRRETLILKKLPLVPGKHKVIPDFLNCDPADPVYGILYTSIDGDVSGDTYNILTSEDNFFQVDSYNSTTREIKGKFQLTFLIQRKGDDHYLPDTLRFKEGVLHTKIMSLVK